MTAVPLHLALGAVIGSAVGDALGAPFEFGPAGAYSRRYPEPVVDGIGEMEGGGGFGWAPGEFTDDTQMAIVQAESILERAGIDGAHLFDRFKLWASGARDVGSQTRATLGSGLAWDVAARDHYRRRPDGSAGNGTVMRATPTAVRFSAGSESTTVEAAHQTAAVTHGDPAAAWGTALFHVMVRAALLGSDCFAALDRALTRLPRDQVRYVEMLDPGWRPADTTLPNGTVWTCLAQAVWAVRTCPDSFEDALRRAIDLGGDTDTVAAVAGGLAGARLGVDAIPGRWTIALHGHVTAVAGSKTYRTRDLEALTARLIAAP